MRNLVVALLPLLPVAIAISIPRNAGPSPGPADSFVIENDSLIITIRPSESGLDVLDKRSGTHWSTPPPHGRSDREPFRDVRASRRTISLSARCGGLDCSLTLTLPARGPVLAVEMEARDPSARFNGGFCLDALLPPTADASIAVADYCDGHLYPVTLPDFPSTWFGGDRLDMPWVGVCVGLDGPGYLAILETSDDSCVELIRTSLEGKECRLPRVGWLPSKGAFAYRRHMRLEFVPNGGYVALAKAYRAHARRQGLVVPLREKARKNPNVRRLYGAVDVWGDASAEFARAAKDAGVERMILHGRRRPEDLRVANDLGYLTSEYDNYTDILPVEPGKSPDSQHDYLPGAAVLLADGTRMKAWLTYDKKTQFMKRCPALWTSRARDVITGVLKEHPFLGRFIDVTTAEALYECYDPNHPLDRAAKRRCGEELLRTVREMGLVVGGEHGIWWAVPYLDYIEGMMSSYQFAWPAGHLIRPKSKDETFSGPYGTTTWERYARFGIGHEYRVPLWQLAFHDCIVSTWYWGDSNDFLMDAAPEYTVKKKLFNILYGTVPMLWADEQGSWRRNRELFLQAVQTICPVARAVAEAEMVEHRFLTPDRAVQQTRFSNGVVCIVNFGERTETVTIGRTSYVLPPNGFVASGKGFHAGRYVINGQPTLVLPERRSR